MVNCNLPPGALQWVFAQPVAGPIFVDGVSAFKCQRIAPWLAQVHTIKLNRLEAQALSGIQVDCDTDLQAIANWLHGKGVQQVLISLGKRGAMFSEQMSGHSAVQGWQAAWQVNVVNTTGAGDALMAGVVHGYMHNRHFASAVSFALGCAAMTVSTELANHPGLSVAAVQQLIDTSKTIAP